MELHSDYQTDFQASARTLDLGAVLLWSTTFQPVYSRRTPKLIRQSDPERLNLSLPLSGELRVSRGQGEALYGPHSLCVVDTSQPVEIHAGEGTLSYSGVGLEVPKDLLPLSRKRIDDVARQRISAQEGYGA